MSYVVETGYLFTGLPEELDRLFHGSFSSPELVSGIAKLFNQLTRFQDAKGMQLAAHTQKLLATISNTSAREMAAQWEKEAANTPIEFQVSDNIAVKTILAELVLSSLDKAHQNLLKRSDIKTWMHACLIQKPQLAAKFLAAGWKPDIAFLLRYDLIRITHNGQSFKINISPNI